MAPARGKLDPGKLGGEFRVSDGHGVRGIGEGGLAGRTVHADLDGDGVLDAAERSATTSASGAFTISLRP